MRRPASARLWVSVGEPLSPRERRGVMCVMHRLVKRTAGRSRTSCGARGDEIRVANSRGIEGARAFAEEIGATPVDTSGAVEGGDAVILSIPLNRIPAIAPQIAGLPTESVLIDTSNYYPQRDDRIEAIEAGRVESLWVPSSAVSPSSKPGTRSAPTLWRTRESRRTLRGASLSRLRPTASAMVRWRGRLSKTPGSTLSTLERWQSLGGNALVTRRRLVRGPGCLAGVQSLDGLIAAQ